MFRHHRTLVSALATGLLTVGLLSFAAPAVAAVPGNDTQAGALDISALPTNPYVEETTEATVDTGEDVAKDYCLARGAVAFEHAVWFKAVVASGGTTGPVILDVSASDYKVSIAVLQETANGLTALACLPDRFVAQAGAGAGTYYLVMFGDGRSPATGGNLVFSIEFPPPPMSVSVTIDPVGTATKEGGALISGTVTCTGGGPAAQVFYIDSQVTQTVGRFNITSYFSVSPAAPCDGGAYPWQGYAPPTTGKFAGGKAVTVSFAFGCGDSTCTGGTAEATVKLNKARR
jgi:hypothetical protein